MTVGRSKRRSLLALTVIVKSISKNLSIQYIVASFFSCFAQILHNVEIQYCMIVIDFIVRFTKQCVDYFYEY